MSGIVGTWRLVGTMAVDGTGEPLPPPYGGDVALGTVQFTADGRMFAMLCNGAPELADGQSREFVSYGGRYTFDGERLVTHVDVSSRSDWMDTEQVRNAAFDGETLVLRPPLRPYGSVPEQRELRWVKISDR